MPKLSDNMSSGTIIKWYKKVGDDLVNGDILAEFETDLATLELENFDDGTFLACFVNQMEEVPVGAPLLLVGNPGDELEMDEGLVSLIKNAKHRAKLRWAKMQKIYLTRNGLVYGPYSINSINEFLENKICRLEEPAWTARLQIWISLGALISKCENENVKPESFRNKSFSKNANKVWELIKKGEIEFAIDLVRGLDDADVCREILLSVRLEDNNWYSNIKIPAFADHEHGVILFLVCLEKLADVEQIPEYFKEMQSFVMGRFIPIHYLNSLRVFSELRELSLNVSEAMGEDFKFLKLIPQITKLSLSDINENINLDFLSSFVALESLVLEDCKGIELNSVFKLPNLVHLKITKSSKLKKVPSFDSFNSLRSIDLSECSELEDIKALEDVNFLEYANLSECKKLAAINGLSSLQNLKTLNISWCDQLTGPMPEWILSIENLHLEGSNWQIKYLGKRLAKTSVSEIEVLWNGSGDDGYCERFAYDLDGNQLEDDETNTILGLTENFVMCKLPGGAGNDSGSHGVMKIDVVNGCAVWDFHWKDGLDFFRHQMDLWSKFEALRFEFDFVCFQEKELCQDFEHVTAGNWQWCFYEDGPMGLSLKKVDCKNGDTFQNLPIESEYVAMEDLFRHWVMNVYFSEVDDVLNKLCDGCKGKLPDYLLQCELVVELNCLEKQVTLQINDNFETIDLELEREIETYDL
jgi:hypothetical protein